MASSSTKNISKKGKSSESKSTVAQVKKSEKPEKKGKKVESSSEESSSEEESHSESQTSSQKSSHSESENGSESSESEKSSSGSESEKSEESASEDSESEKSASEESEESASEESEQSESDSEPKKRQNAPSNQNDSKKQKQASGGTKTIFVGNLSFNVDKDWLKSEFEECGQVVDARVVTEPSTGRHRGFGFVQFADEEGAQAAYALKGKKSIDGREINIDLSTDKAPSGSSSRNSSGRNSPDSFSSGSRSSNPPSLSLFVGSLSYSTTEESLSQAFSEMAGFKNVRVITDRETGRSKGFAYVDFESIEDSKNAMEQMQGAEVDGRNIKLDFEGPKGGSSSRGGFNGGNRGGRGGSRGGPRGGSRGGRGFSRGGFSSGTPAFSGTRKSFD